MLNISLQKKSASVTEVATRFATAWARRQRTQDAPRGAFVLDGTPLADADIGSPTSLLPLFAWHADNLYRFGIEQHGLGYHFHSDGDALLMKSVNLDRTHRSPSEVVVTLLEALEDTHHHLVKSLTVKGAVELRPLVNQFAAALNIVPIDVAGTSLAPTAKP